MSMTEVKNLMGRENTEFLEGKDLMGTGNTKLGRKGQQRRERTKTERENTQPINELPFHT
jgi:hypothetical protein